MTEKTTTEPGEDSFILEPFILVRVIEDGSVGEVQCATMGEGDEKALLVFRTAQEAVWFQETTGECTPEEGYEILSDRVSGGALVVAKTLEKGGLKWVAVPDPGIGKDLVHRFTAEGFLKLLDERTVTIEP